MIRYMLDTDTASYLIRGDQPEVTAAFREKFRQTEISALTAAELRYGAQKRNSRPLTQKVQAFCDLVPCVDWDGGAAECYARLRTELEADGSPIGAMDMLIAASALAENAILVTHNRTHFSRIRGLKIEDWVK